MMRSIPELFVPMFNINIDKTEPTALTEANVIYFTMLPLYIPGFKFPSAFGGDSWTET